MVGTVSARACHALLSRVNMPPAWVCVLPMVVLLAMAPLQPTRAFCASRKSAYHRMTCE